MKKILPGFTLVELLVVIAIIGILVATAVTNYITAQKQARDASRVSIMHNAQTAFEQYYGVNGSYPPSGNPGAAFDGGIEPSDPKNVAPYKINWTLTGTTYCICAKLEVGLGNAANTTCASWNPGGFSCIKNQQ